MKKKNYYADKIVITGHIGSLDRELIGTKMPELPRVYISPEDSGLYDALAAAKLRVLAMRTSLLPLGKDAVMGVWFHRFFYMYGETWYLRICDDGIVKVYESPPFLG